MMADQLKKHVQFLDLPYMYTVWSETPYQVSYRKPKRRSSCRVKCDCSENVHSRPNSATEAPPNRSKSALKRESLKCNSPELSSLFANQSNKNGMTYPSMVQGTHVCRGRPAENIGQSPSSRNIRKSCPGPNQTGNHVQNICERSSAGQTDMFRPRSAIQQGHSFQMQSTDNSCRQRPKSAVGASSIPNLKSATVEGENRDGSMSTPSYPKVSSQNPLGNQVLPSNVQGKRSLPCRPKTSRSLPCRPASAKPFAKPSFTTRPSNRPNSALRDQGKEPIAHGVFNSNDTNKGVSCNDKNITSRITVNTSRMTNKDIMAFWYSQLEKPGLTVWKFSKRKLHLIDDREHGFFHEGHGYLVARVANGRTSVKRHLHCWTGRLANAKDAELLEKKVQELESVTGKVELFSVEHQGHETVSFSQLFPQGICYVDGKSVQGKTGTSGSAKRVYQIMGRKYPSAKYISSDVHISSLDSTSAYLTDGSPRMYLWLGSNMDTVSKIKALQLCRGIRDVLRDGNARIIIINETDSKSHKQFLEKIQNLTKKVMDFDDEVCSTPSHPVAVTGRTGDSALSTDPVLYRLTGVGNLAEIAEASRRPLNRQLLSSQDLFLLDTGPSSPLSIWEGRDFSCQTLHGAFQLARGFIKKRGYSNKVPIVRIQEGNEPTFFVRAFLSWRNEPSECTTLKKSYSAGTVGKRLFARRNNYTIGKTSLSSFTDADNKQVGKVKIWRLECSGLVKMASDQYGIFYNDQCYVILVDTDIAKSQRTLYCWMGKRSDQEDKEKVLMAAWNLDKEMGYKAVLIRVLDRKEPSHFLASINHTMMVVTIDVSSLSSHAAILFITNSVSYLWYGKECGGYERDYAKKLLRFLKPNRCYNFAVESEGKESPLFRAALGESTTIQEEVSPRVLSRRKSVLIHYDHQSRTFTEIPDFLQQDLSSDATFILDSFDQITIWVGGMVEFSPVMLYQQVYEVFLSKDPAGRHCDDVSLRFIKQSREPDWFTYCFPKWNKISENNDERFVNLVKLTREENITVED